MFRFRVPRTLPRKTSRASSHYTIEWVWRNRQVSNSTFHMRRSRRAMQIWHGTGKLLSTLDFISFSYCWCLLISVKLGSRIFNGFREGSGLNVEWEKSDLRVWMNENIFKAQKLSGMLFIWHRIKSYESCLDSDSEWTRSKVRISLVLVDFSLNEL